MQHRGELLKEAIHQSGIPIARIVKLLGKSRSWMYNQFENPNVPIDVLLQIEKLIRVKLSKEIPELQSLAQSSKPAGFADDTSSEYGGDEANYWKTKYLKLLEEHTALLKSLR